MSTSPATNPRITFSSSSAGICPWATPTRARGASARTRAAMVSIVSIRLCTTNTCPPRSSSRAKRLLEQRVVPRLDEGQDRRTVPRRRLDQRQVAEAGEREVQRARDRRRGQREHVHREPERLEPLLVPHPEAMLLVHDQQAEVLEGHVLGQQPVGADHDVGLARVASRSSAAFCSFAVRKRDSTSILHREVGQPLEEGAAVLLGQNRRRHQHRHLLAALHRLERRAHRDLGLAVPDVADQQPVHGPRPLHVLLDLLGGLSLVRRVLVEEARLQLALPLGIGRKRIARR